MEYKFRFSVIIPVYRTEKYLTQMLDSVIGQDIGFEKHIQIILVRDKSQTDSEETCLAYQKRYPQNIVCAAQEQIGLSAAYNEGIRHVQGKYVNFSGSAFGWKKSSFRAVYEFFEKRQGRIDVVFGQAGRNRVIDVLEQYTCLPGDVSAAVFRADVLAAHQFDERLRETPEAEFVNAVILDKLKFGVVADARQTAFRGDSASSCEESHQTDEWYLDVPRYDYMEIIRTSVEKYGEVLPYVQYRIACEIPSRLRDDCSRVLVEDEQQMYEERLREVFTHLDDDILCQPDKMNAWYRMYVLSLKYGSDIRAQLQYRNASLFFKNIKIYSFESKSLFSVDVLEVADEMLHLAGRIWCPFADELSVFFENERGECFPVAAKPAGFRTATVFGRELIRVQGFEITLPLEGTHSYTAYGAYQQESPRSLFIRLGKFARLSREVQESYYEGDGYRITLDKKETGFHICKEQFFPHLWQEIKLLARCLRDGKYGIAGYRMLSRLIRPFLRKERWLVMERIHVAGDNAEHFYRFLKQHEEKDIRSFFVISDKSPDFEKMKRIGAVLPFRKFRYKLNVLLAKNIISSQAEDNLYNPWDKDGVYIRDLFRYRFVFLQHGIIKDDLSEWLNKMNKNLQMFVTSARPEYQSILDGDYFYDESVVKLTGLPRYDNLKQDIISEKSILFLPTWRFSLAGPLDNDTGERAYQPSFKDSDFFRFYQKLIQDERLLDVLKKHGYKGRFFLHTHHNVQLRDFADNDTIQIIRDGIDYQEEFQKNALLITDFSSVAFDFAYLKKPVIYAQFDIDTFFDGQVYSQGYFDYERDGLGPVCYDYETTLRTIIDYVEHDCQLEAEYDKRSSAFYRWFDNDNCKRVYEEIRALGQIPGGENPVVSVRRQEEHIADSSKRDNARVQELYARSLNGSSAEERQFLYERLQQMDDALLCDCAEIPADIRLRLLSLKYGRDIQEELIYRGGRLKFENLPVVPLKDIPFVVETMEIIKGRLNVKGTVMLPLENQDARYFLLDHSNKEYEIRWEDGEVVSFLGETMGTRKRFAAEIPLGKKAVMLRFMCRYQDTYNTRVRMAFTEPLGIQPDSRDNFTLVSGWLLKSEKQVLSVTPLGKKAKCKLFFTFPGKSIKIYLKRKKFPLET